ncbi:MAG: glycosyltransferase family 2 protein, partial [Nitrosopumilaceae archaeon]
MTPKNSTISNNEPFVSIIIINYNGKDYILDCIESVFKTTGCKFEVILIDNGSTDNGSIICKEKYSKVILFQNKKNIAMAARNIGIDHAKGNFIVFLDADTIVEPKWLQTLLDSYKIHGEGLYQCKLLEKDRHDIISGCGNMANIFGFGFARGKGTRDNGQYDDFEIISFPVGACTFSSSDIIKK